MSSGKRDGKLSRLLASQIPYSVVLAEKELTLDTLLRYSVGSVIVFPQVETDRLRLEVAGNEIARGTAVTVASGLGLRVNEIPSPRKVVENILSSGP